MRFSPFRAGGKERRLICMQGDVESEQFSPAKAAETSGLSPEALGAKNRADAARYFAERFVQTPLQALGKQADLDDVQKVQGIFDALVPAAEGATLLDQEEAPVAQEIKRKVEEEQATAEETSTEETLSVEEESPPPGGTPPAEGTTATPAKGPEAKPGTPLPAPEGNEEQKVQEEKPADPERAPASLPSSGDAASMSEQELLDAIHAFTGAIYPLVKQNEEAQELRARLQAQVDAERGDGETVAQIASLDQEITKRNQELVSHRDHRKQFEEALRQKLERGEA
ncbi:MAG: hypothetical protein AAB728_02935 [Patescibacteria group bacterium]